MISKLYTQHVAVVSGGGYTYLKGKLESAIVSIEPAPGEFNSGRLNFKRR